MDYDSGDDWKSGHFFSEGDCASSVEENVVSYHLKLFSYIQGDTQAKISRQQSASRGKAAIGAQ